MAANTVLTVYPNDINTMTWILKLSDGIMLNGSIIILYSSIANITPGDILNIGYYGSISEQAIIKFEEAIHKNIPIPIGSILLQWPLEHILTIHDMKIFENLCDMGCVVIFRNHDNLEFQEKVYDRRNYMMDANINMDITHIRVYITYATADISDIIHIMGG